MVDFLVNLVYLYCMEMKINQPLNIPTARLLLDAFRAFENELAEVLGKKGFSDVTTANFNLLRHLDPGGMRLSELARDAQVSKQAIGKMVKDLEYKGYVKLISDKADARAKHVNLTNKGRKLIDFAIDVVSEIDKNYQLLLGKKDYNKLRQSVKNISDWHLNK